MIYRYPKAEASHADAYYQESYDKFEAGLVTTLPDHDMLASLRETNFAGSRWDESSRISLVTEVRAAPARILDYGCSWGYFMAQAQLAGFTVSGFEPSRPRAKYGVEQLGLAIATNLEAIDGIPQGSIDIIYTSHVLEHLPDLVGLFDRFRSLLLPGGSLIVLTPNCGGELATRMGVRWGPFINEAHTLALTAAFFERNLPRHGFAVAFPRDLDDDELVVVATAR